VLIFVKECIRYPSEFLIFLNSSYLIQLSGYLQTNESIPENDLNRNSLQLNR